MSEYRDDFTDLLGAYALDAVDPLERHEVEAHLGYCPFCAAEVAQHREVAAVLSHSGTGAPAGVWDRIAAELSPPAPPMRLSVTPPGEPGPSRPPDAVPPPSNVVGLAGRRSIRTRTFAAVVSAAAVLLAVLGFVAVDQQRDVRRLQDVASQVTTPGPGALTVKLVGSSPRIGAQAVVNSSGQGYLVPHDLPEPGRDELYQLWGQVDGVVLSLGTFDADVDVVDFHVDPDHLDDVQAFAITKERAPGVVASKQAPVLAGKA